MNRDGRPDFSVPARLPFIELLLPRTTRSAITVTAFGASCGTASTTINPTIPGTGLPGYRVPTTAIFAGGLGILQNTVGTCTQASIVQALIDARGCFAHYTSVSDVPAAERAMAQQYYGSTVLPKFLADIPCRNPACEKLVKLFTKEYSVYVSGRTVNLNGLTITPASGHAVVVDPDATRVFSSRATVKLGPIVVQTGKVDLDFTDMIKHTGKPRGGGIDSYNGFTQPAFTFDASKGLPVIGGFPVNAGAELAFAADNGVRESKVTLHIQLPKIFDAFGSGDQPSAAGAGVTSNDQPFHVDTLDLMVPHASLGGIGFDNVAFHYAAGGDALVGCRHDYWHATANITFGQGVGGQPAGGFYLTPPPKENGIAFCDGDFKSVGLHVSFTPPLFPTKPELFPGLFLDSIDGALSLNPTLIRAGFRVDAGNTYYVDGVGLIAFARPWAPYHLTLADEGPALRGLGPRTFTSTSIAAGGAVGVNVGGHDLSLGGIGGMYSFPDYAAIGGNVDIPLGVFRVYGGISGDLNIRTREAQLSVDGHVCIQGIETAPVSVAPRSSAPKASSVVSICRSAFIRASGSTCRAQHAPGSMASSNCGSGTAADRATSGCL